MEIINSINEAMRNRHNGEKGQLDLSTTKAEKKRHGIGLKNVRKIVEKYDGIMKIFIEDNLFHVKLVLYIGEIGE